MKSVRRTTADLLVMNGELKMRMIKMILSLWLMKISMRVLPSRRAKVRTDDQDNDLDDDQDEGLPLIKMKMIMMMMTMVNMMNMVNMVMLPSRIVWVRMDDQDGHNDDKDKDVTKQNSQGQDASRL